MKKLVIGLGVFILLVAGGGLFNHYYYFAPNMEKEKIVRLAEQELKKQSASLLQNGYDPNVTKKFSAVKVLDVKDINNKTYLVFKMDFKYEGPEQVMPYGFNSSSYILGLRMVEKKLGGIALKNGMEFESNYLGVSPADCGQDENGVFYAFCKDPRVKRVVLESDDGKKVQARLDGRVVLEGVPAKEKEVRPHFFAANGAEIELSSSFRTAFLSSEEKNYQPYTSTPMEWWLLNGKDISCLTPDSLDALWIFPDQQQDVLQGDGVVKLKQLAEEGIPLVFIGMKDVQAVARAMKIKQDGQKIDQVNIEAVYVGKAAGGDLKVGTISLDDNESFPVLQKSIALRYQIENYNLGKSLQASPLTVPQPAGAAVKGVTI